MHVNKQNHASVRAHWENRFLELNPELIKCKNPQFSCEVIIISSYRMIPCHMYMGAKLRGLITNKAMKHEKQLDVNSHRLLSKSHPFISQHAPAYSQSHTVISKMCKTTLILWETEMACGEICSLVKKKTPTKIKSEII